MKNAYSSVDPDPVATAIPVEKPIEEDDEDTIGV